ncbi:MAG: DUF309 domain-containing protein [Campylobacterales bacterium]|nr:DUF309 domain-containing protein [Campylobacterales bacterium]
MIEPALLQTAMKCFVQALESGGYYEAHEQLEALWFERRACNTPEIALLKGYINAAVSFELERRGRVAAAQKPWRTFEKYLPQILCVEPSLRALFDRGYSAIAAVKSVHVSLYRSDAAMVQSTYDTTKLHLNHKGTL